MKNDVEKIHQDASRVLADIGLFLRENQTVTKMVGQKDSEWNSADVTAADLEVDQMLRSGLSQAYPDFGFLTEESGYLPGKSEYTWILDPIDGTTNYYHGLPFYGVFLTLLEKDTPIYSQVIFPELESRLWGAADLGGAFVDDGKVPLSVPTALKEGKPYVTACWSANPEKAGQLVTELNRVVHLRNFGCAAYETYQLLVGQTDGVYFYKAGWWDAAAAATLAPLAGLSVKWFSPEPQLAQPTSTEYSHSLIVGKPAVIEAVSRIMMLSN